MTRQCTFLKDAFMFGRSHEKIGLHHGFTLIELLVVISIVAILVAIMLPALSQARDATRQVACASNAKQIMFAWNAYQTDSAGRLPYKDREDVPSVGERTIWATLMNPYLGDARLRQYPQEDSCFRAQRTLGGILSCPSMAAAPSNLIIDGRYIAVAFSDYGMNNRIDGIGRNDSSDEPIAIHKIDEIAIPSQMLIIGDSSNFGNVGRGWYNLIAPQSNATYQQTWGNRHASETGLNIAFADAHVALRKVDELGNSAVPDSVNPPWLSYTGN